MSRPVQGTFAFPLLDGESESSALDAAHWTSVYEQLVSFCSSVLAEDDVVESVDRDALRRRLRHFEQRHEFWASQQDLAHPA